MTVHRIIYVPSCVLAQGTPSLEALKLQYYQLMIRFYQHERDHLEVCRCYRYVQLWGVVSRSACMPVPPPPPAQAPYGH